MDNSLKADCTSPKFRSELCKEKARTTDDIIQVEDFYSDIVELGELKEKLDKEISDVKPADAAELERGQHISVPGKVGLTGCSPYRHHAIIVKVKQNLNAKKPTLVVIHTHYKNHGRGKRIQEEELEYDMDTIRIRKYDSVKRTFEEVAQEAERFLKTDGDTQYNLIYQNCEHFCTECVIGISVSCQVLNIMELLDKCRSLVERLSKFLAQNISPFKRSVTLREFVITILLKLGLFVLPLALNELFNGLEGRIFMNITGEAATAIQSKPKLKLEASIKNDMRVPMQSHFKGIQQSHY